MLTIPFAAMYYDSAYRSMNPHWLSRDRELLGSAFDSGLVQTEGEPWKSFVRENGGVPPLNNHAMSRLPAMPDSCCRGSTCYQQSTQGQIAQVSRCHLILLSVTDTAMEPETARSFFVISVISFLVSRSSCNVVATWYRTMFSSLQQNT